MYSSENSSNHQLSENYTSAVHGNDLPQGSGKGAKDLDLFKKIVVDLDLDAFAEYYTTHKKALVWFARRYLPPEQAEESVQNTVVKIIELVSDKSGEYPSSWCKNYKHFDTWFHTILKNLMYQTYEKEKNHQHYSIGPDGDYDDDSNYSLVGSLRLQADADTSDPLRIKSIIQRDFRMRSMIKELEQMSLSDIKVQRAFMFANGQTYQEIADAHGIPLNTAKSSVFLARKALGKKSFPDVLDPV